MQLTVRQPSASADAKHYTTERLRSEYLIETVFVPDDAILTYSHFDRIIAGGVMPVNQSVELVGCKELASDTFLQRREMGVINIGGKGKSPWTARRMTSSSMMVCMSAWVPRR